MRLSETIDNWGSRPSERSRPYPCDSLISSPDAVLFRAVDVQASPSVVFRWLCQLRVAPYSYDWIDNLGRRSPRHLVAGLEELEVGQRVMTIFTLASFVPGEHITVRTKGRLFGDVAVTYMVVPSGDFSRLVVKMLVRYPRGVAGAVGRAVLPAGDLVMMRRQLRTLAQLAERDQKHSSSE